uniref:Uncharacterized protein n=1 Tax=Parascaris equorum TaxID=6256 RepID=A0A914RTL3_PAREQ
MLAECEGKRTEKVVGREKTTSVSERFFDSCATM